MPNIAVGKCSRIYTSVVETLPLRCLSLSREFIVPIFPSTLPSNPSFQAWPGPHVIIVAQLQQSAPATATALLLGALLCEPQPVAFYTAVARCRSQAAIKLQLCQLVVPIVFSAPRLPHLSTFNPRAPCKLPRPTPTSRACHCALGRSFHIVIVPPLSSRACAHSTPVHSSSPARPHKAMEHFDTSTMSYMPMPIPLQTVTGPDQQMAMPMVPMDQYEQRSHTAFDAETFIG